MYFILDRYVLVGNHRDAWVFGAMDPSSGTALMMEISRVMGELVKTGRHRIYSSVVYTLGRSDTQIGYFAN